MVFDTRTGLVILVYCVLSAPDLLTVIDPHASTENLDMLDFLGQHGPILCSPPTVTSLIQHSIPAKAARIPCRDRVASSVLPVLATQVQQEHELSASTNAGVRAMKSSDASSL